MTKRRVAILIEITDGPLGFPALRRFLKALARAYGIKCIGIRPPSESATFQSERKATSGEA